MRLTLTETQMYPNSNMATGEKAAPFSQISFDSLLDETCERLLNRQAKYFIQRIGEMEKRLCGLESELDEFMQNKKSGR